MGTQEGGGKGKGGRRMRRRERGRRGRREEKGGWRRGGRMGYSHLHVVYAELLLWTSKCSS